MAVWDLNSNLRCIQHADILKRTYLCQVSDTGSPEPLVYADPISKMAATAGHRLTLDPRPCKQIPVFPVSDPPYFLAPTLIVFQQIKKKSEF